MPPSGFQRQFRPLSWYSVSKGDERIVSRMWKSEARADAATEGRVEGRHVSTRGSAMSAYWEGFFCEHWQQPSEIQSLLLSSRPSCPILSPHSISRQITRTLNHDLTDTLSMTYSPKRLRFTCVIFMRLHVSLLMSSSQVGNLSFYTTEEQIYELFSKCTNAEDGGGIKRIIMGLDRNTRFV